MSSIVSRPLLAFVLAPMIMLAGCDGGGGSSGDESEGVPTVPDGGVPGIENPGADGGEPNPESPKGDDGEPDVFPPMPDNASGETASDLGQYASEILGAPGIWRIQREIDALATPAEWEAEGFTSEAGPEERDLIAWNSNLRSTGFFSVSPGGNSTRVTECLSGRRSRPVDAASLNGFFSPYGYFLCEDRETEVHKLSDESFAMKQQCAAGDSVSIRFDKIADEAAFENVTVSLESDVIPPMYLNQGACGSVYTDIITEGEAWSLVKSAHGAYGSGRFAMVSLFASYEGYDLRFTFTFNDLAVGEYQIGSVVNSAAPMANFYVVHHAIDATDEFDFYAYTGTVTVLQYDSRGLELGFQMRNFEGGSLTGQAAISYQ